MNKSKDVPILKVIKLASSGEAVPAVALIGRNPELAAAISKMVTSPMHRGNFSDTGQRKFDNPDVFSMRESAIKVGRNASDSEMVMQMLPDMELSAQILTSSILSPKDMITAELNHTAPEGVLPVSKSAELLTVLRTHFEQVYKIKANLPRMLREILFETGSHVLAVIPESSIDDVINRTSSVSMESLQDTLINAKGEFISMGLLGSPNGESTRKAGQVAKEDFSTYSVKSVAVDDSTQNQLQLNGQYLQLRADDQKTSIAFENLRDENIVVNDNPFVLKYPEVQQRIREQRVQNLLRQHTKVGTALEALSSRKSSNGPGEKLSDREINSALYRPMSNRRRLVTVMKTQEQLSRRTIGLPLVLQLPSESVIPVHVPGQENQHVGYFVLLDVNGNPVSRKSQRDYYSEFGDRMRGSSNTGNQSGFAGQMISKVNHLINGFDCSNKEHMDYSFRVYQEMVEQDLVGRLRNGVYANGFQLASNAEIYRIMLARSLAGQQSQLLFLPVEFVTYMAFRYNADGIGKSLLDDMKILNSQRVMLMFANTMAAIRNSMPLQQISIKLDENDPDPYKTIERHIHEIIRVKQQAFPIAVSSPLDVVDFLQRSGYDFKFSGHPGLPDIDIDKTDTKREVAKPDAEYEDSLRKRSIMATGLNPETVDQGFAGEFATSVVANNILLSRRVNQYQQEFTPMLADHMRKHIRASADLWQQLLDIVEKDISEDDLPAAERMRIFGNEKMDKKLVADYLLNEFIRGYEVTLPSPNVTTLENQFNAFESFMKILDPALEAWISEEFLTEQFAGLAANRGPEIKKLIRAYFVRRWMAENGVMPELSAITSEDADGSPSVDFWEANEQHVNALLRSLSKFVEKVQPGKEAADTIISATAPQDEGSAEASASNTGGGALDDMAAGGGSADGGDDFGVTSGLETDPTTQSGNEAAPDADPEIPGEGDQPELNINGES